MEIKIPTTEDKIFKQYLTILNTILSERRMTKIEIEVLAKLLYVNHRYRHIPKEQRDKLLFHKNTKEVIRKSLNNLSKHSYNNIITSLRKKNIISNRELLVSAPLKNKEIILTFKLTLS